MSILSTRNTICEKISSEFDSILSPIQTARQTIMRSVLEAKSLLANMTFSPSNIIDDAIGDLEEQVRDVIPEGNPADIQETIDFINSCNFLSDSELLSNPIALYNGAVDSVLGRTWDFVSDLSSSLPEFNAGQILGNILSKYSGLTDGLPISLDISNIMRNADTIINCIAGRCGLDFADRVIDMSEQLDILYQNLNIISDPNLSNWGEFDLQTLYADAALSAQEIIQMDKVVVSVQKTQSDVVSGINNMNSSLKTAARSVQGILG